MRKLFNLLVLTSSLLAYMEWGTTQHAFLFQAESDILGKAMQDIQSVLHPLSLIPFIGQLLLLITLFQKMPSKRFTIAGILCLASIILFVFFIGLISLNLKIILSCLPFLIFAFLTFRLYRGKRPT